MPGNRGSRGGRGSGGSGGRDSRSGSRVGPKKDADVLSGPGVVVTCVKNKERSAISEAEAIFSAVANELYPELNILAVEEEEVQADDAEVDIEKELAADLEKERNYKKETPRHFMSCQTDAQCIVYVNFRPPIDPVRVVERIFSRIEETGLMNFAYCLRLLPISATCPANMESLTKVAKRLMPPHFDNEEHQEPMTFRVETKGRYNDEGLNRNNVITYIPKLVPSNQGHRVNFDKTDKVIVVETYKNATGMSILDNFDRFKKYNLRETHAKYHKSKEEKTEPKAANLIPTSDPRSKDFGEHYMENEEVKAGAAALMTDILAGQGGAEAEKSAVNIAAVAADAEVVAEVATEDAAQSEASKRPAEDESSEADHSSKKLRLI